MSTPTRGVSTPRIRTTGGEYFHEFEYQDWEEVDITKPIPIWICLLLVFGILFGGDFTSLTIKGCVRLCVCLSGYVMLCHMTIPLQQLI